MYLRDPGGNILELTQREVTTLDRARVPLRELASAFPQSEDNLRATLFLDTDPKRNRPAL